MKISCQCKIINEKKQPTAKTVYKGKARIRNVAIIQNKFTRQNHINYQIQHSKTQRTNHRQLNPLTNRQTKNNKQTNRHDQVNQT